mgnify:CR=1 FL=1
MRGAFQVARFFGIPVQVHWTFGLMLVGIAYLSYSRGLDWSGTAQFTLFFIVLFICVIFHEFGHALTARRFGVNTRDIILSPIGGVARLDKLPDSPIQEFLVAVAGPVVNIAIALSVLPYILLQPQTRQQLINIFDPNSNVFFINLSFLDYFLFGVFLLNITLAGFNLLPAFPMDGGRILRALLSIRLGRIKATRLSTYIGQGIAVLFVIWGILDGNLLIPFIGLFVFVTAAGENRMVQMDSLLEQYQVKALLRRFYTRIYVQDPMERPVEELTHGLEHNFLVFDEWQNLVGTLSEEQLMKAVERKDFGSPVSAYLHPGIDAVVSDDNLRTAVQKLQSGEYGILPVFEKNALVGVVDAQSINNFIAIQKGRQKDKKKGYVPQ